jgi:hypothetical protein
MNRKSASAKRSNPHGSRPRLTVDISPSLKRRIKIAAASQEMPVSAYVTRLLDRTVPPGRTLKKAADGSISSDALRRFAAFRAEQRAPFPEDSADLIREIRAERETHL